MRLVPPKRWVSWATWAALLLAGGTLSAQVAGSAADPLANSAVPTPELAKDRPNFQRFSVISETISRGDLVSAEEYLRRLLEMPQDSWIGTGAQRRGLRSELIQQLQTSPAAFRELYARDMATRAATELTELQPARDVAGWLRLAARYPETAPARQALRLAAHYYWDRGDFAAAASISARSLPPPQAARAADLPVILHTAAARWRAGDRPGARSGLLDYARLFDAQSATQAEDRIAAALASFGDSRGANPSFDPTFPGVTPRWSVSILNDKTWNELYELASQDLRNSGLPVLPAAIPCLTDKLVLLRTYSSLVAFDLRSGKPAWECAALSESAEAKPRAPSLDNPGFRQFKSQELVRYLVQNQVTGSCVADAERAYFIGDRQRVVSEDQQYSRPHNQIVACRLSDGSIAWQTWTLPELADICFLSQPIQQGGRLYVIGESDSQLKLVVLKCSNGRVDWQLPLASVKQDLEVHPGRKLRQLPVVMHEGRLICPTGSGCVVSIDTISRSYDWAYRYPIREVIPKSPQRFGGVLPEPRRVMPQGGWQRVGLACDTRRAYFVSPEGDLIQAIDLRTGQLNWEQPRQDGIYLAGLVAGKLLVAGDRSLKGLDPDTGEVAWQRDIGCPSGIGVVSGTNYLLPLESGAVLLIDGATGRVQRGAQGDQAPLGNLVQGPDVLVSLTPQRLEIYGPWEAEYRELLALLMRKSDDPDLLAQLYRQMRRGGDVAQVVSLLRDLYRQEPSATVRVQLVRALIEYVVTHPEQRPAVLIELQPLVAALGESTAELRCRIQAEVVTGDRKAALQAAIKLAALVSTDEFEPGSDQQSVVRSDRAVQGLVLQLIRETPPADRPLLEKLLDETLQAARGSSDPFALQRFSQQFNDLPWGRQARLQDHTRIGIGWPAFRQELNLLDLADQAEQTMAAAALFKLAQEMTQRSFRLDATRYYANLRDEFPDVRLDATHTVTQIIDELPSATMLLGRLKMGPLDPWPQGTPEISKPKDKPRETALMPIPIEATPGSLLDRINVSIDRNATRLICQGDWYPGYWEIPLPRTQSVLRQFIQTYHGWGLGQLLVVRLGTQLFGVSLLDDTGEPNGRIVWTYDLTPDLSGVFEIGQIQNRRGLGEAEVVIFDEYGREVGQICVMLPGYFCYRHRGEVVVVETATGRQLWRRRSLPPGIQVAGDGQALYLLHPDEQRLETVRIVDGSTERTVPWPFAIEARPLFHRGVAIVSAADQQGVHLQWVRLRDLQVLAEHRLPKISHRVLLDPQTLACLQQDHTLVWFELGRGTRLGSTALDVPPDVSRVHTWQDQSRFYVLPSGIPPYRGAGRVPQIRDGYRQHRVQGTLHAIDRRGGQVGWKRPLEDVVFPLDQPRGAPIFMLNYRTLAPGVRELSKPPVPGETEGILQVIDRRTGLDLHREQSPNLSPAFTVEVNLEHHTVDIHGEQERLRLEYPSR